MFSWVRAYSSEISKLLSEAKKFGFILLKVGRQLKTEATKAELIRVEFEVVLVLVYTEIVFLLFTIVIILDRWIHSNSTVLK